MYYWTSIAADPDPETGDLNAWSFLIDCACWGTASQSVTEFIARLTSQQLLNTYVHSLLWLRQQILRIHHLFRYLC
jgi:hypothetical protein